MATVRVYEGRGRRETVGRLLADATQVWPFLVKYIMETRGLKSREAVTIQQKLAANQEQEQFLGREMSKVASGSDKTIREAVIVIGRVLKR